MPKLFKLAFLLSLSTAACGQMTEFKRFDASSEEVELHRLVPAERETPQDQLIDNSRVLETVKLNSSDRKSLFTAMLDKKNYGPILRRCEMNPTYAITINGELVALFDPEFCPRIEYFDEEGSLLFDISTENSILKALKGISFE